MPITIMAPITAPHVSPIPEPPPKAEAKEARNAYRREWYRNNKDKVKAQHERYWAKKAAEMKAKEENANDEK